MALKNPDQLFKAGLGSTEGFVTTIIHMIVLLPVSTWVDGSPDNPFQKMQLSQLEFYKLEFYTLVFYKKLPKENVKRDIDLSSQTQCSERCWGKADTQTQSQWIPLWPGTSHGMKNTLGKEWDLTSNLSQNFTSPEAGLHLCSHSNNAPSSPGPQIQGSGRSQPEAGDGFTHSPWHPSAWHHSVNHTCLLSKIC